MTLALLDFFSLHHAPVASLLLSLMRAPQQNALSARCQQVVAVLLSSVVLLSCHDLTTGPELRANQAPAFDFSGDPGWGRNSSPNTGAWDVQVDPWDGSTPMGPAWTFPYRTVIVVDIGGNVTQASGAFVGSGTVWGPTGLVKDNGQHGMVGFRHASASGSSMWWPQPSKTKDTVIVQDEMRPVRDAVDGAQPANGPSGCGRENTSDPRWPCYTYLAPRACRSLARMSGSR